MYIGSLPGLINRRHIFYFMASQKRLRPNYDISRFTEKIPTKLLPLELGEEQLNIAAPIGQRGTF